MPLPRFIGLRIAHKPGQTRHLSRRTAAFAFLLADSILVTLVSLLSAHMADSTLETNARLVRQYPWFAWVALPLSLPLIAWLTRCFAPYTTGSGIPQVLTSLSLLYGVNKAHLVPFGRTLFKTSLTFIGMVYGTSIGREGSSVQIGAAVMSAWGGWYKKHNLAFRGIQENDLIAAGAAGGLATAFNAPLAGMVFTIEELNRGTMLRWRRQILSGVLAADFIQVAVQGDNPYFSGFHGGKLDNMLLWVLDSGLACGIAGGLFGQFLYKDAAAFSPQKWRGLIVRHPLLLAAAMGVLLALLGTVYQGQTYGTGYNEASGALRRMYGAPSGIAATKQVITVFSYRTGIPGGIFIPSLIIGAVLGNHVAALIRLETSVNVITLICIAAFLAGVTQSPLIASMAVMEMTNGQNLPFQLLISTIAASQASHQFSPEPFYHAAGVRLGQQLEERNGS